jgi:hypothetical protein
MIRFMMLLMISLAANTADIAVANQPRSEADSPADLPDAPKPEAPSETSPASAGSPGIELAERHLPELLPVLGHLRDHEPQQYAKAIADLDRAAKRLEIQSRRGEQFFDAALRQWQSRGRVDLLKARVRVRPSEADSVRLKAAMKDYRESELARLKLERETLAERERMMTRRAEQATRAAERAAKQLAEIDRNIERVKAQRIDAQAAGRSAARRRAADGNPAERRSRSVTESEPNTKPEATTEEPSE